MERNINNYINFVISTDKKYKIVSDKIISNKIATYSNKIIKNCFLQVELYKPGNINNYAYLVIEYQSNNSNDLIIEVNVNSSLLPSKKDNIFHLNNVFWGIPNNDDKLGEAILITTTAKVKELNFPSGKLIFKSGAYREDTGTSCALMEKMALFALELLDKDIDLLNDNDIIEIWKNEFKKPIIYRIK